MACCRRSPGRLAAELVRRFIETHDDARFSPTARCYHGEMPAKINDVLGHWGGRRYRQACGGRARAGAGRRSRRTAAGTTTREAARSGGKVVKRTKKSRPPTSPQAGPGSDTPHRHTPHATPHHTPRAPQISTHHTTTFAGFASARTVASPAAGRGVDHGRRGEHLHGRLRVPMPPGGGEGRGGSRAGRQAAQAAKAAKRAVMPWPPRRTQAEKRAARAEAKAQAQAQAQAQARAGAGRRRRRQARSRRRAGQRSMGSPPPHGGGERVAPPG